MVQLLVGLRGEDEVRKGRGNHGGEKTCWSGEGRDGFEDLMLPMMGPNGGGRIGRDCVSLPMALG